MVNCLIIIPSSIGIDLKLLINLIRILKISTVICKNNNLKTKAPI
jgi:hypothetical protein